MNTAPLAKRRAPRYIVAQAIVMALIAAITTLLVFHYWHIHKPLSVWIFCTLFNFLLFIAVLWFMRWLDRKRETWNRKTERRFSSIMLLLAVAFLVVAIYMIFASR